MQSRARTVEYARGNGVRVVRIHHSHNFKIKDMKKLILSFFLLASLIAPAQNQALNARIDSAKTFTEMPVLKLTVVREANMLKYVLSGGTLTDTKAKTTAGVTLTLCYPVYVYSSGKWSRAEEKYNYISTAQELTDTTVLIHRNLVMYLSTADRRLLIHWLNKYEALGKERMKIEQPHLPQ